MPSVTGRGAEPSVRPGPPYGRIPMRGDGIAESENARGFAKCSPVRDATVPWPGLQRQSMTRERIHVSCNASAYRFDLTYHDSADLVVPGWLLGLTDSDGRLCRTDFLASAAGPGALRRWLEPLTGPEIALKLVRRAQDALATEAEERAAV